MLNGSLAVWCDVATPSVVGLEARLDLHFNMWLDLPGASSDVLDVGILLKETRQIEQLNIFFPAKINHDDIFDLSKVLRDDSTLSAVFNSTLSVADDCVLRNGRTLSYRVKDAGGKISFSVIRLDSNQDYRMDTIRNNEGTVVSFTKSLFEGINEVGGTQYIRFRLRLRGDLKNLFRDASSPNDNYFLSGFHETDLIEFRINERRNFGDGLRNTSMSFPIIDTIHYFLLRDIETELVQSHADFKKIRRLEPNLWQSYLNGLGTDSPENWVAYHWKSDKQPNVGVEDFIALAIFKKPRYHVIVYLIVFVILGAAGSATQAAWTKVFGDSLEAQGELIGTALLMIGMYVLWSVRWRLFLRIKRIYLCARI